ncbi:hypothetical protein L3i22_085080 [Actinoplanes sp. L3-i22]|nr:hypothetical protein L3i22_085080 [Actinoplanes sp. L3-i22]
MRRGAGRTARGLWIAATSAMLAAMLGAWLGWQLADDLPTAGEMRSLVEVVAPGAAVAEVTRADQISGFEYAEDEPSSAIVAGSDEYGAGYVEVAFAENVGIPMAPVAQRLRAAGWRVGDWSDTELTAAHGGWRVQVYDDWGPATVRVERAEPITALLLTALSGAAGAWLGWILARRVRISLGVLGTVGFVMLLPNTLAGALAVVGDVVEAFGTGLVPLPWEFMWIILWRPLTLLGLLLVGAWLVQAFIDRPRSPE